MSVVHDLIGHPASPSSAGADRDAVRLHLVPAPTPTSNSDEAPALTRREVEVLMAWLAAESKAEAAQTLFITASTVNTHLARIRNKYTAVGRPARSKANLFARAIQDGYTTLDVW